MASPLLFEKLKKILPPKPWSIWDYAYSIASTCLSCLIIGIMLLALCLGRETPSKWFEDYFLLIFGSLLWYLASYWVFHGFPRSWIRFPIRGFWVLFSCILLAAQFLAT